MGQRSIRQNPERTLDSRNRESRSFAFGMGTQSMQIESASNHRGGYALVSFEENGNGMVPHGFPIVREKSMRAVDKYQHLFVLCSDLHLPVAAEFVSALNRIHKLQALFVKSETNPALLPQMLERANLRLVHNMLVHQDSIVPRRVMTAWQRNAQSELIATASIADDRLIVVSCEPKTYEVSFNAMPALKKVSSRHRRNFEIAEDGAFIHWPLEEIHLDLDAIRSAIDPLWRKKSERIRRAHGRDYGRAIASVRRSHGLKQSDAEGISERQLRRIEQTGDVSISV